MDLPVLDVFQIFGRAGRPGLESSGEGYICTTEDKLTHYLDSIASQVSCLITIVMSILTTNLRDQLNRSESVALDFGARYSVFVGSDQA